jgi:hypothetical protein
MGPRTRRERGLPPGKTSPPSLPPRLKRKFVEIQMKRMQKNLKPIDEDFDLSTISGIKKLNELIVKLVFERRLASTDARSINEVVRNHLTILMPSELEGKVDELLREVKDTRETVNRIKRARPDEDGSGESSETEAD